MVDSILVYIESGSLAIADIGLVLHSGGILLLVVLRGLQQLLAQLSQVLIHVSLLQAWLDCLDAGWLLTNHLFLGLLSLRDEHSMSQNSFFHHSTVIESMLPFVNGFLAGPRFKLLSVVGLDVARESCVVFFAHDLLTRAPLMRVALVGSTPMCHLDLLKTLAIFEQATIIFVLVCVVACN